MARLAWTFKECWISTYESGFLAIPDAKLYTVEDGELKQLTFDEAMDMSDSLHDIEPTYEVGASGNFNITYLDEFKHTKDEWFVHEVDVNDFRFINAYRSLSVEQVAEALRMFKVITHCSIINLLTHSLGYQVLTGSFNFVSCPLRDLSDAEKLFLQCFLAEASKTPLVIQNNLNTLTNSSLRSLYDYFKDSEYITICTNDITDAYILSVRLTGKPDERLIRNKIDGF